jgi:hypothetical protein
LGVWLRDYCLLVMPPATSHSDCRWQCSKNEKPGECSHTGLQSSSSTGAADWCGGTGGRSLRRARTEPSCVSKVPREEALDGKRKPRAAVPWAYRYAFPRLHRANLIAREGVNQGDKKATEFKSQEGIQQ